MAESYPLLNLAARGQQLRQGERREGLSVQQQQRPRRSPQRNQARRAPSGRRRSSSYTLRRVSTPPLLPVIHEDSDPSSSTSSADAVSSSSPGSLSRSGGRPRRSLSFNAGMACNYSPSSSSSSSSSSGRYDNYNSMSYQIIWPPEDDNSWPPRNCRPDEQQVMVNYGSVNPGARFLESGDLSSSPASESTASSESRENDYSRYHSSQRYRRLRLVFTAFFGMALSAAVWLPLLQEESSRVGERSDDGDYSSNSSGGYFRAHHKFYDEVKESDYYSDPLSRDFNSSDYPDWYRHRRGTYILDGDDVAGSGKVTPRDSGSHSIPANISFANLAAAMLPPYFQKTIDLCLSTIVPEVTAAVADGTSLLAQANATRKGGVNMAAATTSVMPGEVYLLRKTMLKTRDLLDVFSPAYSKHSSEHHHLQGDETTWESDSNVTSPDAEIKDLWKTLRHFLNNGYMLLGDFQDLDHARIRYTPEQLAQYQQQIWQWHDGFMSFVQRHRYHISSYLSRPCEAKHPTSKKRCRHVHSHSSHLFWGNATKDELPDGIDGATPSLWRLGSSQLGRAQRFLREALTHDHVIPSIHENATNATEGDDAHEVYHNLRKELRSFVDELNLFGHLLLPDSSLIPDMVKERVEASTSSSGPRPRTDQAIRSLKRARKLLGDLNDNYVARSRYVEWEEYPEERVRLEREVESQWSYFRTWALEVELFRKIQFLRDKMDPDATFGAEAEFYSSSNPSYSLELFLRERKADPTYHFAIGNDAGDADSIVSAILLAYVESMHGDPVTPIVSIPRESFIRERPDVNLLFRLAGIRNPSADLLFVDDLVDVLENEAEEGLLSRSLTLVDHNTMNPSLKRFSENLIVTEIVDHHKDEGEFEETCAGTHRNVAFDSGHALVASAATLVAERLQECSNLYPSSVGTLLIGVILLDSINLNESVGKVTKRDRDAVDDLMSRTDWSTATPSSFLVEEDNGSFTVDTDELFTKLQQSKYDPEFWSLLTVTRALRYDYKEFHFRGTGTIRGSIKQTRKKFGISSVLVPGLDFMSSEGFYRSTLSFMDSEHISFLGIMFAYYDARGIFQRQLAFVSIDRTVSARDLARTLPSSGPYRSVDPRLEKVRLPAGLGSKVFSSKEIEWRKNVVLFNQNNVSPSRKQIGPMLEDYFDGF